MTRLSSSLARRASFSWRTVFHLGLGVICVALLVGTSTLAGAAADSTSAGRLSARLTKTSFTSAQAGSVKLVCKFKKKSGSFSYLLTLKKGKKWQTVKSVKKKGYRKGAYTMSVKKVFAGKPVKLGSYRLKVSAGSTSKLLRFTVVKAKPVPPPPTGSAPVNTSLPTISGTVKQGQTLSASNGSWTGSPTLYAYRWNRCTASGAICTDIGGATSSTYALVVGDVGSTIRIVVTASNSHGSTSATSSQTAAVAGFAPANTALPAISGTARDGQTLTASDGSWTGSPTPSLTHQWLRCDASGGACSPISGATASTYTLVGADDDSTIRAQVTGTNSQGSASAASAQTLPVAAIVNDISAARDHSCAVLSNGKVECWGTNDYGQLGNGTQVDSSTPVQVTGISTAIQVASGGEHSCAVLSDHTVKCWGRDYEGQLGDGVTYGAVLFSLTPVQVKGLGGTGVLSGVAQVSAGDHHTCAVLSAGTAWCWGSNSVGELGMGTFGTIISTPVKVLALGGIPGTELSGVTQVSAGSYYTCAVSGGFVYCWGDGMDGELGQGDEASNYSPVKVKGFGGTGFLTGASEVSAKEGHTCARLSGGSVWCWGWNGSGDLGNDTSGGSSLTPVQVKGVDGSGLLAGATHVSVGGEHSCALLSGGGVACWGGDNYGQLGNDSASSSLVPVQVKGTGGTGTLANVTQLSAGFTHNCALLSDHSVKCWGNNYGSQLGSGQIGHSTAPVSVAGLTGASHLSAGYEHACALRSSDGTVWCWGHNNVGQLGNGTFTDSSTPVEVKGVGGSGFLTGVTQVSAGGMHTCALVQDDPTEQSGKVYCWGYNFAGQLGDGSVSSVPPSGISTPVQVGAVGSTGSPPSSFLEHVIRISAGGYHTCALVYGGTVDCWGYNSAGQLGDGLSVPGANSLRPVVVVAPGGPTLIGVDQLDAGSLHTCAVKSDHTVWCWGYNGSAQLGNNLSSNSSRPVQVWKVGGTGTEFLSATELSASYWHSCAVLLDGTSACWGTENRGQFGNGTASGTKIPVLVLASGTLPSGPAFPNISGVTVSHLSAGAFHSCALVSTGAAYCWGLNDQGALGDGTEGYDRLNPVPVSSLGTVSEIASGGNPNGSDEFTCALASGGTVKCWGSDYYGELGDGGIGLSKIPVAVVGLP